MDHNLTKAMLLGLLTPSIEAWCWRSSAYVTWRAAGCAACVSHYPCVTRECADDYAALPHLPDNRMVAMRYGP